ncbi:hypothetical protein [Shewanella sp.]|uniref:hypothetical protein n=1 Tax=Shewanella TaxID=22 RepID=UPI00257B5F25|nr:hypothetical protein [Shewanella sp.]
MPVNIQAVFPACQLSGDDPKAYLDPDSISSAKSFKFIVCRSGKPHLKELSIYSNHNFYICNFIVRHKIAVWVVTLSVRLADAAISPALKVSIKLLKRESAIVKKPPEIAEKIKIVIHHQVLPVTIF